MTLRAAASISVSGSATQTDAPLIISTAIANPATVVDALVRALPPLPALDPLPDPNALSVR